MKDVIFVDVKCWLKSQTIDFFEAVHDILNVNEQRMC